MMGRNTAKGKVICRHMVTDATSNILAALNVADFEGIVCIVYKLHLVICNVIGLGSLVKPE